MSLKCHYFLLIPLATRPKEWVCGPLLAGIVGLSFAGGVDVCCECSVLSARCLCVGLITCTEEYYQVVWCV